MVEFPEMLCDLVSVKDLLCLIVVSVSYDMVFATDLVYRVVMEMQYCLQCFDTVGWAAGRASGL